MLLCFLISMFFMLYSFLIVIMKIAFKVVDLTIYVIASGIYASIFFMIICCCGCLWGLL